MAHKIRRRSGKLRFFFLRSGCILLAIAVLVALVDFQIRPVVTDMSSHQAKVSAMRCINTAMTDAIRAEGVSYEDMVKVTQNGQGEVTSIQSNMVLINYLKVSVTDKIMEELLEKGNQSLEIPVGTLTGLQFAAGKGPGVKITMFPIGYVQTKIQNRFTSAGINQTLHQIMMETGVEMMVVMPGYRVRTETVTNYCIAETVIVGKIPESYTDINGDDSSTISKVNDYVRKLP